MARDCDSARKPVSNALFLFRGETCFLRLADNELVSIDWVAFLESLRFLDCSENRISALPAFARALATPPRLEEAIAEGNPVR